MKSSKLTSDKLAAILLSKAPEGVTDIYFYKDAGWVLFIAYKGQIFYKSFRMYTMNAINLEEDLDKMLGYVWHEGYMKYMELEVEKRSNNSVN